MAEYEKSLERIERYITSNQGDRKQLVKDIVVVEKICVEFERLRNEHCLLCEKYKYEHLGACKDCRWKQ